MVIGNGQLATIFSEYKSNENVVIFASGVSNSNCVEDSAFEREAKLLHDTLTENSNKQFVYFSSCALSAIEYPKNRYYMHKQKMEELIKRHAAHYYIFRVPQLFGDLIIHNTIINYIYNAILSEEHFYVYSDAYRYVIEINDVKKIVDNYLLKSEGCLTVDVGNPYQYRVLEIVKIFESLLNKKAHYEITQKEDQYNLSFADLQAFLNKHGLELEFGEGYLSYKLAQKIKKEN